MRGKRTRAKKPFDKKKALTVLGIIAGLILIFYVSYAISFSIFSGSILNEDKDKTEEQSPNVPSKAPLAPQENAPSSEPEETAEPEEEQTQDEKNEEEKNEEEKPESSPEPSKSPAPSKSPEPSKSPAPSKSPEPTSEANPSTTPAPVVTSTPKPSVTPPSEHLSDTGL